tara:strand:+ start:14377 stop:14901 length:525 start_codon:yes stop_codon:yes gene_type:complete
MSFEAPARTDEGYYASKYTGTDNFVQINRAKLVSVSDDLEFQVDDTSKCDAIDTKVLAVAKENSVDWFKKDLTEKTLMSMLIKSVSDDGTITVNKTYIDGELKTKVFNLEREPLDIDKLVDDSTCDIILEYTGVAFAKKNFQVDWRVAQIRVHPPPPPPKLAYPEHYMFQDDEC